MSRRAPCVRGPMCRPAATLLSLSMLACGGGGGGGGTPTTWYGDSDGDGYGDPAVVIEAVAQPAGYVAQARDCDDARADTHPGAAEVCDERDQDCDAAVDEGLPVSTWHADADGDRHGDPASGVESCHAIPGHVEAGDDCDDADPQLRPDATWYLDADGDSHPDRASLVIQCARPAGAYLSGSVVVRFDCDDTSASVRPFAREVPFNGIDDDCDPATPDDPAFGPVDYSGVYRMHGLTAGKDAPQEWIGWTHGTATVAVVDGLNAVQAFHAEYFGGSSGSETPVRQLTVGPTGGLYTADAPDFWGTIALDDRTVAATLTELDGAASLMLYRRLGTGHATADLAADWSCQGLVVTSAFGDATWYRGDLSVGLDGTAYGSVDTRAGEHWGDYFTPEVAEAGEVAWDRSFAQPGGHFALSENRELVVGVSTHLAGGVALEVAVRRGGLHATADLAGEWSFHALAAGSVAGARSWGHGALRVAADGTVEVVHQTWLEPGHGWPTGELSAADSGALTLEGLASFGGQLSRSQELFVATWSDPAGADVMAVVLRRRIPIPRPVLEPANAVGATVTAAGGVLEATGTDGTRYLLEIPAGALAMSTAVTLTPVASFPGLPLAGPLAGAVQLAPEGLRLLLPATLVIEPAAGAAPLEGLGFGYAGAGTDLPEILPASPVAGPTPSWAIPVLHFSGAGLAGGSAAGEADPDAAYRAQATVAARQVVALDGDLADIANAIEPIMVDWLEHSILPRIDAATSLGGLAFGAVQSLHRWQEAWMHLGEVDLCTDYLEQAAMAATYLRQKVNRLVTELDHRCAAATSRCVKQDLAGEFLAWNELAHGMEGWSGFSCLGVTAVDPCNVTFCSDVFDTLPALWTGVPAEMRLYAGQEVTVPGQVTAYCGQPLGVELEVASRDPRVATASGRTVKGEDIGATTLDVAVKDMACVKASIPLSVSGVRTFMVTVLEMGITSSHPECNLVEKPAPYRATITVDDRNIDFSAYQESGSGRRSGGVYTFRTTVPNWILPIEPIGREWALEPTYDERARLVGMAGSYEWGWMGLYDPGQQRFTGCRGFNNVVLVRDPPPSP